MFQYFCPSEEMEEEENWIEEDVSVETRERRDERPMLLYKLERKKIGGGGREEAMSQESQPWR